MFSTRHAPIDSTVVEKPKATRDGLEREQVSEIQRARLLAAMTEVVCERGAAHVTVAHVVQCAGVSRRTFYELFDDREECFMEAFEEAIARASRYVLAAYDPGAKWAERIRMALAGLLAFLDVERDAGRLLIDGSLGAGPRALERRKRVLDQIVAAIAQGRREGRGGEGLPPLTAEGIVGGIFSVIHSRLMEEDDAPLVELVGPLMAMIVLPYLGAPAARRELARPVPKPRHGARRAGTGPLRDLGMRLTYRTMRVLLAIDARPGASNREVADNAGIRDQGQISKLLARLQHLGLVSNAGDAHAKGEANAWALTERGLDVQAAISTQSSRSQQPSAGFSTVLSP